MYLKQGLILISGIMGILLVALCPRWFYPDHPLMPVERNIGYRFVTSPPQPLPVIRQENGIRVYPATQFITAHIDRRDLSARIVLIIAITAWGLWILRRLDQIENRKKHWLLITLATLGLVLAAHIQAVGKTI